MWIINVNGTVVLVVERASMLGRLELTLVLMSKIFERKSVIFSLPITFSICFGCKMEKRNSQLEHWQPKEQKEACLACATQVWLAVNHNTSIISVEWVQCSKCITRTSELDRVQLNLCNSWGYEQLQKSNDSLKNCFEIINIFLSISLKHVFWVLIETVHLSTQNIYVKKIIFSYALISGGLRPPTGQTQGTRNWRTLSQVEEVPHVASTRLF